VDTLPVVLVMVAVAALLLCAAVLADRKLQQRAARRRALEEDPNAPRKHDAADAFIEMLDRAREAVRRAADEAAQQNSQS
jgi:hypothetical protein